MNDYVSDMTPHAKKCTRSILDCDHWPI